MIIKRKEGKRNIDYGMSDYYKFYKSSSKKPVDSKRFNKIVSEFNSKIIDLIINDGLEFTPKMLQFTFCVRKIKRIPRIENGKLINTTPIDWKATKDLWDKYEDAKDNKTIIRYLNNHTSKYIFRIKALREHVKYKNKHVFKFKPCRSFQRSLSKRILNTKLDNFEAYELY
jgi:hypothetical protein